MTIFVNFENVTKYDDHIHVYVIARHEAIQKNIPELIWIASQARNDGNKSCYYVTIP
jgi:hypothetical protein